MADTRKASPSVHAARAPKLGASRLQHLGLAATFIAVSLTTLQGLMLTTRVYASYSPATFASALLPAAILTPLFYVALRGLLQTPRVGLARVPVSKRALAAGCAYAMGLVAVFDLNASLDRSTPNETSFAVVAHLAHEDDGDRAFINVVDKIRPTTRVAAQASGLAPLPFSLSGIDEFRVTPGKSRIVVPMRAGLFGIPWFPANDYRLEQTAGA